MESVVCSGCFHTLVDDRHRCGTLIHNARLALVKEAWPDQNGPGSVRETTINRAVLSSPLSLREATERVVNDYPACQRCLDCPDHMKRYWRYDRVLESLHNASVMAPRKFISASTTNHGEITQKRSKNRNSWILQLPSVPPMHRLPRDAVDNVTAFFLSSSDHVFPAVDYLFDFNPSIVKLPSQQQSWTVNGEPTVYVMSLRVSNRHYCWRPADRQLYIGKAGQPRQKDYLGLALLSRNLTIVTNFVVDVKQHQKNAEDFRLFVLHDQLFLSSSDWIAPIWIQHPDDAVDPEVMKHRTVISFVFGDDSDHNPLSLSVYMRNQWSCVPCGRPHGPCGKNLNFFETTLLQKRQTWAEIWPSPPHVVAEIADWNATCNRSLVPTLIKDEDSHSAGSVMPSFGTVGELILSRLHAQEKFLTRGRGGACCIEMQNPHTNTPMLVGIQHAKTPSQGMRPLPHNLTANHYLSSVYAFEPEPPFRIIAQSGFFCFGFPDQKEQDDKNAPLVRATQWRYLRIGNERFLGCPRIQFVSGMTKRVDDPTKVLVAYGINDCVTRMVEMSTIELEKLLFGGLS